MTTSKSETLDSDDNEQEWSSAPSQRGAGQQLDWTKCTAKGVGEALSSCKPFVESKKKTSNFCQTRTLTNIRNYNRQLAWASVLPQEDQGALLEDFALTDRGAENSDQIKYEES